MRLDLAGIIDTHPAPDNAQEPGFGLYVHWPFCKAKCPYCDFNSHVRPAVDHDRWRLALLRELEHMAGSVGKHRLTSIFFGGGTPSLMAPTTVEAVIDLACTLFEPTGEIEITLEANPTSVEAAKLEAFSAAGVNRVSLGVQSLDPQALRHLGREHSVDEALAAVAMARDTFARVSFDLIYARAGQSVDSWLAELDQALAHTAGHLSLYQLTIEPGTRFHALHREGRLPVMPDDAQAALLEATRAHLQAAGLAAYEVSNYARPGEACRHNLVYWRYGDYLGIGPGAHGRLTVDGRKTATSTLRRPEAWLDSVEEKGHGELPRELLTPEEAASEAMMMGLRLEEGLPLSRIERLAGRPALDLLDQPRLERAVGRGLIELDGDRLRATPAGRLVLDGLLAAILR